MIVYLTSCKGENLPSEGVQVFSFHENFVEKIQQLLAEENEIKIVYSTPVNLVASSLAQSDLVSSFAESEASLRALSFLRNQYPERVILFEASLHILRILGVDDDSACELLRLENVSPELKIVAHNAPFCRPSLQCALNELRKSTELGVTSIPDEFINISNELLNSSRYKKLSTKKQLSLKAEDLERKLKSTEASKTVAANDAKRLSSSVKDITSHLLNAQEEFESLLKKYNSEKASHNRISKERDSLQRKVDSLQREIVKLKKENSKNRNYVLWLLTALQSAHQKLWKRSFRFRKETRAKANKIKASEVFDAIYYNTHNSDVGTSKMLPEIHYVLYGAYEGRNPSPSFSTINYISKYHDVAVWGGIPLIHYIEYGAAENRDMS